MAHPDKNIDREKFVSEAESYYEKIKSDYEPDLVGKFLAIDPKTKKVYLADTSIDALDKAKDAQPTSRFFIKKIGFGAIGTLASYFPEKNLRKHG